MSEYLSYSRVDNQAATTDYRLQIFRVNLESMKGIVFTEFLEMIEQEVGITDSQELLESLDLTDSGAYTSVGDYPFAELVTIISTLSERVQRPVPELLFSFGLYFAKSISNTYRVFFEESDTLFDFLASVHNYIHVEVKKLYTNAMPPTLLVKERSDTHMVLHYTSHRALGDFAEGLITGVSEVYNTPVNISRQNLNDSGTEVLFEIMVRDGA